MEIVRKDDELPMATGEWGWKYHHLGVPTRQEMPGEVYLEQFRFYVSGFSSSPFGIEWMRFEPDCPIHPLIQSVPHLAFEVDNLELELAKHPFRLISPIEKPSGGVRSVMIEHNGAPVELIEFSRGQTDPEKSPL